MDRGSKRAMRSFSTLARNPFKFYFFFYVTHSLSCSHVSPKKPKSLRNHKIRPGESVSPHVGESGFRSSGNLYSQNPESWKFLLVESGILGFGIRNLALGIRNPTKDWNPESEFP